MNSEKKIALVTGASGFIGEVLCQRLLAQGYKVKALARSEQDDKIASNCVNREIQWISGKLADGPALGEACKNVRVVFHLAGLAHANGHSREKLQEVNVAGTANIYQAAQQCGVEKFVYVSSSMSAIYDQPGNRQTEQNPSHYAESKHSAELAIKDLWRRNEASAETSYSIARPVNVYGPKMKGNILGMIKLAQSNWFPSLPKIDNQLSLVGVNDLVSALLLMAESAAANMQTYTITDGIEYSTHTIEESIYHALHRKKPKFSVPFMLLYLAAAAAGLSNKARLKKGGISLRTYHNLRHNNLHSSQKIVEELGYSPTQSLPQLLPEIISTEQYMNSNTVAPTKSEK